MALKEYLGATGLTDILTRLKTWVLGEVPKAIPAGGTTGQVLKKASNTDRDVTWGNASSGGGHTIVDGTGTSMADESNLQFVGLSVTDDSTNGRTVVDASGLMDKSTYTDVNDRIPLTKGGTGANSASDARTNLGLGSAATKSSTTSVTSGGIGLPTSGAVYTAINTAKNDRMAKDGSNADSMVKFSNLTVGSNYSRTSGNNCIMAGEDISASGEYSLAQGSGIGMSITVSCELSDSLSVGDSIIYISIPDAYIGYPCYIPYLDRYGYSVYAHMGSSSEIVLSESSGKSYPDGDPLDVQFYATTSATAYCSQAFGYNSSAGGKYAHAEGNHSRAAREAAHAEGKETISSGEAAHAEGSSTTASGAWSHSEGRQSIASGQVSHAEGSSTQAKGNYSHTEGESTIAYDYGNHAEGVDTVAGDSTSISATAAHAEGQNTRATHSCSHAEGFHTQTGRANQHVQGSYNVGRSNTLFEIGNGTSSSLKNVFEVYEDGSLSTDNGITKVKLGGGEDYTFHIASTVASTAVAWCNKVAKFSAPSRAETGVAFTFSVTVKVGDTLSALEFDNASTITAIYLYDKATAKISNLAAANFTYTESIDSDKNIVFTFTIAAASVTAANATALNAVIDSASPGFAAIYAANTLNLTGTINGKGIVEKIPGFASALNILPGVEHMTQHVGDFYIPTGGPRWSIDVEVDPGTAYMAVCYLENTTTGAYFNHSICYAGVGVPTLAAPTVAPAPVAGKVIAFVGTTWTPFVAGVAGVVTDGVVTTKPRLRIVGYHSNNAPTAGLGMHMRLFRIY